MKIKSYILGISLLLVIPFYASSQQLRFERSDGKESAAYDEVMNFYRNASRSSKLVRLDSIGLTDSGYPLHLMLISKGKVDVKSWQKEGRTVLLVNNGIHAGEPDGIDASMLFIKDLLNGKIELPANIGLAIIPAYNIGGLLNRGTNSRVSQNGPLEYGFRGNAQNLDLNRDFIKADSRNANAFHRIFHYVSPDVFIDNHVSDGADFQHVFTLIATQYNKLGNKLGEYLRTGFEPSLYSGMKAKGWDVFPYVNFDAYRLDRGMEQFYDAPRYSTGYAALFNVIGFMPETHMLKPYKERVRSTYDFMVTTLQECSKQHDQIKLIRKQQFEEDIKLNTATLKYRADTSTHSIVTFLGYERDTVLSTISGLPVMQYNRSRTFSAPVKFYHHYVSAVTAEIPAAYVIPQGWYAVTERLKANNVTMQTIRKDTVMDVSVFRIADYKTQSRPYEKHYPHYDVKGSWIKEKVKLRKGDIIVPTDQPARKFLAITLDPMSDDGYFAWNFFDAILQQKEGYSDYRWEQIASNWLKTEPAIDKELKDKMASDPAFAKNQQAILQWLYRRSPWYEKEHMRYPIFQIGRP